MASEFNVTTKEISPGIFLHKQQISSTNRSSNDLFYIFKVELQRLNVLEFTADFSGSENVFIEESERLLTTTRVNPFSTQIVAKLILKKDWKLKSKFKFTMKPAPKEFQIKYIQGDILKLRNEMQQSFNLLQKYPISLIPFSDVLQILNSQHIKFLDFEFPPIEDNVFGLAVDPNSLDTLVQWRRPNDFMEIDVSQGLKEPNVFYDTIEPTDVKQGILGNFWFASALATLAERPALVERLFMTKEINLQGIYRVKICKNGEWVTVTIDDFFPCHPLGGPIFSRCQGNELWVLILEKAYAKLHGSYFLLRGGYANEALIDLTGCPSTNYNFEDEEVIEMIKNGRLWDILKNTDEEGFLLSASTIGEERWNDLGNLEEEENNLLPGHSYSILQVKEFKNNGLINIRNPWGNFEWNGDWGNKSNLWSLEAINQLNPNLEENDGTFWMSYQDFVMNFKSLNVCKVKNWDEVRIKGKFIKVQDIEDANIEVVMSKWYYAVDIHEKTRVIISLHQEDERIQGVVNRRPYLDIGIVILLKSNDGNVSLYDMKDYEFERQVELELDLEAGSYIILPKTTGCSLKRPIDATNENIKLLDKNGRLNELAISTINDIFRKYDMLLTRELTYVEFKGFYECLNKTISQQDFENNILNCYSSTQRGLTISGFLEFFKDSILNYGEDKIFNWFEMLGYDKDLYSIRSRCFLITFHSETEISVVVRDNVQTDLDNRSNVLIISKYGKEMEVKKGIRAFYSISKSTHSYSYAIVNDQQNPIEVTLDCSGSKNMIFSAKNPIMKKKIDSGVLEFLMHAQAIPSVDNFVRSAKCIWTTVND